MFKGPHIMTVSEYESYADELKGKVSEWKSEGLGYISCKCQIAEEITRTAGTEEELMFTATQLREIFELAK